MTKINEKKNEAKNKERKKIQKKTQNKGQSQKGKTRKKRLIIDKTKFKKLSCSPTRKNKKGGRTFSCYSDNSLIRLRDMWNLRHPDDPIKTDDVREIWNNLKENMRNVCNEESCWMRQGFAKNKITPEMLHYTFMPTAPEIWKKNKKTWLTSTDISRVMLQYEKRYHHFTFIGPSPIDFDSIKYNNTCVWDDLCNFSLEKHIKKGKTKIGIIFNLDRHWEGGSHWVALFIDCDKKIIFYFDSTGDAIPDEIKKFAKRVTKQGKDLHHNPIDFTYDDSKRVEHQLEDTECGIYCLHFITTILRNKKSFSDFKNNLIHDDEMEKCRDYFFNIL